MVKRKLSKSPSCISIDRNTKKALKTYVAKNEIKGGVSAVVNRASRDYLRKKSRK